MSKLYHAVSPRSFTKFEKHLPQTTIDRLVGLAAKLPQTADGFCERLWLRSCTIAEEALQTAYIQGIHHGTLSPIDYGGYTVQDAVYCYNATEDLKTVTAKSTGDVKTFVEAKEKSYEEYTEELFKQWYIADPKGIDLGKAAQEYSDYEKLVAESMDSLYYLVSMVPCDRLWNWLANQIKDGENDTNLYSFWIQENSSGSGGKSLQDFIDARADELDFDKALEVYQKCMQGEVNFFKSATGDYN